MCSQRLVFTKGRRGSKKPRLKRENSCTLVCISSPWCFFCSSWWCVDAEDDKDETSGHRSSPLKVRCDASTDFLDKPFSCTIIYVDPNIAAKRVGENNTQLLWSHWPWDDESILLILTSIVDATILSIVNAGITDLPDPSRNIRDLYGWLQEPNRNGGPYARMGTPIFDTNTAAGWVQTVIKLSNPTLFCIISHGQQADGTAGAQTPMCSGRSYLPLHDIVPPPAKDMIDDIGEELDDDGETWRPNPRSFPTMKAGLHKFECKLQRRIVRQQRYLEVIRNGALGLFADYEQSIVGHEDVAWLYKHDHIVNPPAAGSLAIRKRTSSYPAANWPLWVWNTLAEYLFNDLRCGWVFFRHFGGWTDGW